MSSFFPNSRSSFWDETTVPSMRAMIMLAAITDGKRIVHTAMRTRNHVPADQLAYAARGRRTGVCRGFYGCHIAAHNRRNKTGADLFVTYQSNVCGFHHGISRFDHCDQSLGFNHAECFLHSVAPVLVDSKS